MSAQLALADIERFRSALGRISGFDLQLQKTEQLQTLLAHRIRHTRSAGIEPYLERLTSLATSADELRELAQELTVNETYFFREPAHLDAFLDCALPSLDATRPLRILSAGSSSGEEAYSLAMLLCEHRPDLVARGAAVVGIDLTPSVLEKARRARYSNWSLRQTSSAIQQRYFRKDGAEHVLADQIRAMVTFEQRNLLEEDAAFWRPGAFDVIFCRNVFIYFSPEAVAEVVSRFRRALTPGGFLFLGSAETLRGVTDAFSLVSARGAFFYRAGEGLDLGSAVGPRSSHTPTVLPASNDGWIDAISDSSARLQSLSVARVAPPPELEVAPWDFEATLALFRCEQFDQALASFPSTGRLPARARVLRAVILTNRGDVDAAQRQCRELLARTELPAEAHYLLAYGREQAGDASDASFHYRAACEADSDFAMPRFHLGTLARRRGDFHEARGQLVRAHSLLATEDEERIVLFAGGFTRSGMQQLCMTELRACGGSL